MKLAMSYSDLYRQIEESIDINISNHYFELFELVHGRKIEGAYSDTSPKEKKHHRHQSPVKSRHKKKHHSSEQMNCAVSDDKIHTMVSNGKSTVTEKEEKTPSQSADFRKWLKKKNAVLKEVQRQERLEKMREKLAEEQKEKEEEERKAKNREAYEKWLDQKCHQQPQKLRDQSAKIKNQREEETDLRKISQSSPTLLDVPPTPEVMRESKLEEDLPEQSVSSDDKTVVDETNETQENEVACTEVGETGMANFVKNLDEDGCDNLSLNSDAISVDLYSPAEMLTPKPKPSPEEPLTTKSAKNTKPPPKKKVDNGEPTNKEKARQLKKMITYDEWLKAQRVKSALQRRSIEQEEQELRASLEKMTKEKLHTRQRVENLLNAEPAESPYIPTKSSTNQSHRSPRKERRPQQNSKPPKKTSSSTDAATCPMPERSMTPSEAAHGVATGRLETTNVDDSNDLFALTSLSESFAR